MITKLKEIRQKMLMPKIKFSQLFGIKAAYGQYSKIENGVQLTSIKKALEIAYILDLKIEDIWELSEDSKKKLKERNLKK